MFYSKKIYKNFYDENFKISSDSKFLSKIGTKKLNIKVLISTQFACLIRD